MTDHDVYFKYLRRRSVVGAAYRRLWLYPRLERRLRGHCLDIGCGIGDMLVHRADTIGVDVNPRTVELCRQRGAIASVMKPDELPFGAASFDSALLDNVLEHILAPQPLLGEIYRVVKPGGRLLIGVPGSKGYASDPDHKFFYDEDELVSTLDGSGFCCAEVFHMPLGQSRWLDRHIRQYCIYALFTRRGESPEGD